MADRMHLFFTRIAVAANTIHPSFALRDDGDIRRIIELWLAKASQFYTAQTVQRPFIVVLRYSDVYQHLIDAYDWPDWVVCTTDYPNQWCATNAVKGNPYTLTRLDADDSYSVDFVEYLESLDFPARRLILHKAHRQFDMPSGQLSQVLEHPSPMFATVWMPSMPQMVWHPDHRQDGAQIHALAGVMGNHGKYHEEMHLTSPRAFALMRITGWNSANQFGLTGRDWHEVEPQPERDNRFIGY